MEMTNPPEKSRNLIRDEEVADGINVIIDDRWVAMFPMSSRVQVDHLVRTVNLAVRRRYSGIPVTELGIIAKMEYALRQVVASLELLGEDGWSDAPYLLRECRKALEE